MFRLKNKWRKITRQRFDRPDSIHSQEHQTYLRMKGMYRQYRLVPTHFSVIF